MTSEPIPVPPSTQRGKSARLEFRLTPDQKRRFEQAAGLGSQSVTEFMVAAAEVAASQVLADRTRFVLAVEQWTAFSEAIDRPGRHLPRLASLLATPGVLDAE